MNPPDVVPVHAAPPAVEPRPDARFDPLGLRAVLYAPKRARRPEDPVDCPGCHPELTPPAISVLPAEAPLNAHGWAVRVVPNKFSCFSLHPANLRYELTAGLLGIQDPAGWCEVVFETPRHVHPIPERTVAEIELCLQALISRYRAARSNPLVKFFYAFKNHGKSAGGTLEHEHWQIYQLSFVPPLIQERYSRAAGHFNETGRSLYSDLYLAELASETRIVEAAPHFISFSPFASAMPYEICIAPRRHSADFSCLTPAELTALAGILRSSIARLSRLHPKLDFNITLHTASFEHERSPWFCWSLSILPRLTTLASVELGLNVMVNPVPPEIAAAQLRDAVVELV